MKGRSTFQSTKTHTHTGKEERTKDCGRLITRVATETVVRTTSTNRTVTYGRGRHDNPWDTACLFFGSFGLGW